MINLIHQIIMFQN